VKQGRLGLLGVLLLVACSQGDKPASATPTPYSIVSVLPTPATPGSSVTAYGSFPKTAAALQLNERSVPARAVQDGLSFTVPEDLLAGTFSVSLPNGAGTPGSLDVRPRLDRLTIEGSALTLTGAGWGAAPLNSSVSVEVGGRLLTPTLTPAGLQVRLPLDLGGPGAYVVRLRVGGSLSNARSFSREAGHLSGQVLRPLAGQASIGTQGVRRQATSYVSVLVKEGTVAPSHATVTPLPGLHRLRLTFATSELAREALLLPSAEPDYPLHLDGSQAVPAASTTVTPLDQWFWPLMGLPQAWKSTRGAGVTVAVIDTGILLNHPAFAGRLYPGLNVVEPGTPPNDTAGHGTHVAGLIAASGDTAAGVLTTGAAPAAMLLPVKVLRNLEGGTVSDLAQGILWAVDALPGQPNPHPAQILNLSLGTPDTSELLQEAIQTAQQKGALIVAATGNDGGPLYSPAALPGVLAVTSVSGPTLTYQPSYANRGRGTRIAAYGGDQGSDQDKNGTTDGIVSTDVGAKGEADYASRQGTSMATPQVSGLAALALSAGTPLSQLRATLEGHASDAGYQGFDQDTGWGVANADPARVDRPRVYVVAQDAKGTVLNWTTAVDGRYTLTNLPPGVPVSVTALTDNDNDGILGEAGDLGSPPYPLTATNAGQATHDLTLSPLPGARPLTLGDQGE
jgi:serine protease